mmetsp:Transcript_4223/g.8032  ORF Transcript_4223/g.8032 Transcript_4223/m.8032 type:complete len:391 (-) Transcript_4223:126-1298(-)
MAKYLSAQKVTAVLPMKFYLAYVKQVLGTNFLASSRVDENHTCRLVVNFRRPVRKDGVGWRPLKVDNSLGLERLLLHKTEGFCFEHTDTVGGLTRKVLVISTPLHDRPLSGLVVFLLGNLEASHLATSLHVPANERAGIAVVVLTVPGEYKALIRRERDVLYINVFKSHNLLELLASPKCNTLTMESGQVRPLGRPSSVHFAPNLAILALALAIVRKGSLSVHYHTFAPVNFGVITVAEEVLVAECGICKPRIQVRTSFKFRGLRLFIFLRPRRVLLKVCVREKLEQVRFIERISLLEQRESMLRNFSGLERDKCIAKRNFIISYRHVKSILLDCANSGKVSVDNVRQLFSLGNRNLRESVNNDHSIKVFVHVNVLRLIVESTFCIYVSS